MIKVDGGPKEVNLIDLNKTTATKFVSVSRVKDVIIPEDTILICSFKTPFACRYLLYKFLKARNIKIKMFKAYSTIAGPGERLKVPSGLLLSSENANDVKAIIMRPAIHKKKTKFFFSILV
ncbi:MAG: hypothetical protein H6774_00285 [Pseudomonadales bacterium]|nr:hypothetical protein [Pseudomonadales bacterium]